MFEWQHLQLTCLLGSLLLSWALYQADLVTIITTNYQLRENMCKRRGKKKFIMAILISFFTFNSAPEVPNTWRTVKKQTMCFFGKVFRT